jgi:hypothetical protein
MAKKPILLEIKKTKHKGKQKFKVRIEGGKSDLEIPQRYSSPYHAKIGALRKLDAHTLSSSPKLPGLPGREWNYTGGYVWQTAQGRIIKFIYK